MNGADFCFIVLIDRSASMSGDRIHTAKEALKLFIQSLPSGSKFSIISFGSTHQAYTHAGYESGVFDYNDTTKDYALGHIYGMDANFGGTDIFTPMADACKLDCGNRQKRIFLLTDG